MAEKMTADALLAAGCPAECHDDVNAGVAAGIPWDVILQWASKFSWQKAAAAAMEIANFIAAGNWSAPAIIAEVVKIIGILNG